MVYLIALNLMALLLPFYTRRKRRKKKGGGNREIPEQNQQHLKVKQFEKLHYSNRHKPTFIAEGLFLSLFLKKPFVPGHLRTYIY